MKPYFVYIVECSDGTLYTGITTEITRRLKEHNGVLAGGAKYTSARRPVKLVAQSHPMENRSVASKLEYQVKKEKKVTKVAFLEAFRT